MASDIMVKDHLGKEREREREGGGGHCCNYMGHSFRLTARALLYGPSHIQDNTYHGLCYISRGALAGTRNSSMGPP